MKLGRGGSCVGRGLSLIASFPLCPTLPVEAYAVVTRLALPFTVFTFRSFLPTFDLPVLAGPIVDQPGSRVSVYVFASLPTAIPTAFLRLGASWLLGSRHVSVGQRREVD